MAYEGQKDGKRNAPVLPPVLVGCSDDGRVPSLVVSLDLRRETVLAAPPTDAPVARVRVRVTLLSPDEAALLFALSESGEDGVEG